MILTATLLSAALAAETPTVPPAEPTLKEALTAGTVSVEARYRYERVAEEHLPATVKTDAEAATLRLALGYTTRTWMGFSASVQYEGVFALGDAYNPYPGRPSEYPVIADPEGSGLNQAWIRYRQAGDTWSAQATAGRQELNLLNQRFLGASAWRQNHQSFDAVAVSAKLACGFYADYDLIERVLRVVGDNAPAAAFGNDGIVDMEGHAFAAGWKADKKLAASAYGLITDLDRPYEKTSSRTFGIRIEGPWALTEDLAIPFAIDAAQQRENAGRKTQFVGDYFAAEGGISWRGISAKAVYERLGSDDGLAAVQTPFATLHAFNGWADVFLTTPVKGLVTKGVVVDGAIPGAPRVSATLAAYVFSSDTEDLDYGREYDAQVTWKPLAGEKSLLIGAKAALFKGEDAFTGTRAYAADTDVSKYWIWTQYSF